MSFWKKLKFWDKPDEKQSFIPAKLPPETIKTIKPAVMSYSNGNVSFVRTGSASGVFSPPEWDLIEVGKVEDVESFVYQAFIKKIALMFKEGWDLTGNNPETIAYVKNRLALIAMQTNIPTSTLLKQIGASLIKKSNSFLLKAYYTNANMPSWLPINKQLQKHVAGYFCIPAETMHYDVDPDSGKVNKWRQTMPDGRLQYFQAKDVCHFTYNKKDGFVFGTPSLVPVMDDIRLLRQLEQNVNIALHQNIYPFFHYKIGSDQFPATVDEGGYSEIDTAKAELRALPPEGGFVTDHRHQIDILATDKGMDYNTFLQHLKNRVFSGLGVSAVDMGEGDCYDELTETLTENGWKFHYDIDHTKEKIATFNPITGRIEWHLANYKYEEEYEGSMVHVKNKYMDVFVTPKHELYFNTDGLVNRWMKRQARDLIDSGSIEYRFMCGNTRALVEPLVKIAPAIVPGFSNEEIVIGLICSTLKESVRSFNLRKYIVQNINRYAMHHNIECLEYKNGTTEIKIGNRKLLLALKKTSFEHISTRADWSYLLFTYIHKIFGNRYVDSQLDLSSFDTVLPFIGYSFNYANRTLADHAFVTIEGRDIKLVPNWKGKIYCYNVPNHLFVTRRNGVVTVQGNTATRSTSDNMSLNLIDSVKDYQASIEDQFNQMVIDDLLVDSPWGYSGLLEENKVMIKFKEIDIDYQIKMEAHSADQFNKNAITFDEMRLMQGRKTISLPTSKEAEEEDLDVKYPEFHKIFWKLIDEPKLHLSNMSDVNSPSADAAAANPSTSINSKQVNQSREVLKKQKEDEAKAKAASLKAKTAKDSVVSEGVLSYKEYLQTNKPSDDKLIQQTILDLTIRDLKREAMLAFTDGFNSLGGRNISSALIEHRSDIGTRIEFFVGRYFKQLADLYKRNKESDIEVLFDSMKFRAVQIEDSEVTRARMVGKVAAMASLGFKEYKVIADETACSKCKTLSGIKSIDNIDDIPPHHPNCTCNIGGTNEI